jgi:dipeptidyl aminopeptidase/acylaminoacyl peptidase
MIKSLDLSDSAPWKKRYRAPVIGYTQLAKANPTRGLAVGNQTGKWQLYAWEVPAGQLRQMTDTPTGQVIGSISSDGRYIYYHQDKAGNEIGHYVRVPFEGGPPENVTPEMPEYSSFSFEKNQSGNCIGFAAAASDGFSVYCQFVDTSGKLSAPRQLFHHERIAFGPALSCDGEIAVVQATEHTVEQHYNLIAFDTASTGRLAELWDGPDASLDLAMFSPVKGDLRLLATTNRAGVKRPFLWDIRSGERIQLDLGEIEGEVQPVDWSIDGRHILLCQFMQAVQHLYVYDVASDKLTKLEHPSGTYDFWSGSGTYFGPDSEIYAQWQDSTRPTRLIGLDAATGIKTRDVLDAGEAPPGRPWKSISFRANDGQLLQAWLGVPEGTGPFPTILDTHGGPEGVMTNVFFPGSQAWLDHGFAFLSVNYRGSTTFGREFQEKIWGNPGHWEVEDMVAARDWLVANQIADPQQILLTGWSYGGYLTLQALGRCPDLWAGGMAGIAIADWRIMYEDSADTLRGYQVALFGGTPQEKLEQYAASSPITYVEQVQAPVLIIQGRNDTRTPARPIEQYEAKMRALGKDIEVRWFEAGHMGMGTEQSILNQEAMMRFAYRVLGPPTIGTHA